MAWSFSPGRVLVEMNLGVLVGGSPLHLLHPATLDGQEDDDDGGEETDYHGGHSNGDQVFLLEPLLHNVLRRLRRDRHHHVQGEVGHGHAGSVLGDALERAVVVQIGPEQDELTLDPAVPLVGVPVVVLAHVDVADHGGAVVDEEAAVPPGDLGVRSGADRADEAHVLALDDLLVGGGGGDERGAGQFTASQVPDELAADPVREGAVGLRLVRD